MSCLNSHFSRDVIILVYVRLALLSPVLAPGVSLEDRHATGYSDGCSAREGAHAPALADYRESARDEPGCLSHFTCAIGSIFAALNIGAFGAAGPGATIGTVRGGPSTSGTSPPAGFMSSGFGWCVRALSMILDPKQRARQRCVMTGPDLPDVGRTAWN